METRIDEFLSEIKVLKDEAVLLHKILEYYDVETMNFIIPDTWKSNSRLSEDKLKELPKSPRHILNMEIVRLLPTSCRWDYWNQNNNDKFKI